MRRLRRFWRWAMDQPTERSDMRPGPLPPVGRVAASAADDEGPDPARVDPPTLPPQAFGPRYGPDLISGDHLIEPAPEPAGSPLAEPDDTATLDTTITHRTSRRYDMPATPPPIVSFRNIVKQSMTKKTRMDVSRAMVDMCQLSGWRDTTLNPDMGMAAKTAILAERFGKITSEDDASELYAELIALSAVSLGWAQGIARRAARDRKRASRERKRERKAAKRKERKEAKRGKRKDKTKDETEK